MPAQPHCSAPLASPLPDRTCHQAEVVPQHEGVQQPHHAGRGARGRAAVQEPQRARLLRRQRQGRGPCSVRDGVEGLGAGSGSVAAAAASCNACMQLLEHSAAARQAGRAWGRLGAEAPRTHPQSRVGVLPVHRLDHQRPPRPEAVLNQQRLRRWFKSSHGSQQSRLPGNRSLRGTMATGPQAAAAAGREPVNARLRVALGWLHGPLRIPAGRAPLLCARLPAKGSPACAVGIYPSAPTQLLHPHEQEPKTISPNGPARRRPRPHG